MPPLGRAKALLARGGLGTAPLVVGNLRPRLMRLTPLFVLIFINSSLAPVLVFQRRLGIRTRGWTTARWQALTFRWAAVCRHGPVGDITWLEPCMERLVTPDLHCMYVGL